jgi:hypothetical protein
MESVNPVTKIIRITTLKNSYAAGAKIYATKANLPLYKTLPYHFAQTIWANFPILGLADRSQVLPMRKRAAT